MELPQIKDQLGKHQESMLMELDYCLNFIVHFTLVGESATIEKLLKEYSECKMSVDEKRLKSILYHLEIVDKFIKKGSGASKVGHGDINIKSTWESTWEGEYFQATSGYQKKVLIEGQAETDRKLYIEHEKLQNDRLEEMSKRSLIVSVFAAFFASSLVLIELVKFYDKDQQLISFVLWTGIAIFALLLRIAMPKIFP